MDSHYVEPLLSPDVLKTLEVLADFTPQQLKIVAEFVTQAGGFENARAAIEAVETLSDAA